MRREYRERTPEQIEQRKATRQQRSLERQAIRLTEVAKLTQEGDQQAAEALQRKADLAQRALDRRSTEEGTEGRKERLRPLTDERERLMQEAMTRFHNDLNNAKAREASGWMKDQDSAVQKRAIPARVIGPVALGPRENAKLILASPRIDQAVAMDGIEGEWDPVRASQGAFRLAAIEATNGDRRRRCVRHAVLVPPVGEPPERATERVKTMLAASGVDFVRDTWIAFEHDGSGGAGQGRHVHLAWIDPDGKKPGGHACAAFAARMWATLNDNPEAAQAISRSVSPAAGRDWERAKYANFSREASQLVVDQVVAFHDPQNAGGLWFQKPGWRADQLPNPMPIESSGVERYGVADHLWGLDP